MKVLIVSDIHGNLPALERVFAIEKLNYDLVISLGDVINYGPWNNECVEYLSAINNAVLLTGNHEIFFIKGECGSKNRVCKDAFDFILPNFKYFDIIRGYTESFELGRFECIHTIDAKYIYHDTDITLLNNFFIGHSHRQFKLCEGVYTLYNVGSVGQNRNNINQINYAVYDSDTEAVDLKMIEYDVEVLLKEFKIRKFPKTVIDYYKSKK